MSARTWFGMSDVTPEKAAMVLCRLDPLKDQDPYLTYVDGDKSSPDRYRLLLLVFEDMARTSPKHRTLMDWLAIAQARDLRYHSWIDDYVAASRQGDEKMENDEPLSTANWILLVQAEATKRWRVLRKSGASPTKNSIKGDLVKWCNNEKIKTGTGISVSGENLYKFALRPWTPPPDD